MNAAVVSAARAAATDCAEVLATWARQPSGSHDARGLAAMRAMIATRLATLPCAVEEVPLAGGEPALRATCRPGSPRRVLLVGHYDTVHTAAEPGPAVAMRSPEEIAGPGVADMKGGILVMLAALAGLEASPGAGRLGWDLLLTPDEELGGARSRDALLAAARGAQAALVFEPAAGEGDVVVARRGRQVLTLEVAGRAAHAGRDPWIGRSAIAAMAELILAVERLGARDSGVSVTVGLVRGGSAVNVVPGRAHAEIDVRAETAADLAAVRAALEADAVRVGGAREVAVRVGAPTGCAPMPRTRAGEDLAGAYCRAAAALGLQVAAVAVGGVSDANHLASVGVPVLDGLGVVGGGLHGLGEWASLASIPARGAAAALLLHGLAAPPG